MTTPSPRELSPEEVAAIRGRADAATKAPWWVEQVKAEQARQGYRPFLIKYRWDDVPTWIAESSNRGSLAAADFGFIAAARTDVPDLCASHEALRDRLATVTAERDRLREEVAALKKPQGYIDVDDVYRDEPLYAERDTEGDDLRQHYMRHLDAMTREELHSKSAIAAELAHRDMLRDRLAALLREGVRVWSFNVEQQPTHTWHDWADWKAKVHAAAPPTEKVTPTKIKTP